MARMSAEEIISHINGYVAGCRDQIKINWYVGIATNPKDRLFKDHCVDEKMTPWIYRLALDEKTARDAEKALLELGYSGGTGGGDKPTFVYAFHKESYTNPSNN